MKKQLAILSAAILCIGILSGCGNTASKGNETTNTAVSETLRTQEQNTRTQEQNTQTQETQAKEPESPAGKTGDKKVVTDAYGNQVTIPADVHTIVETGYAPISSLVYVVTGRSDVVAAMSKTAAEGYKISMWSVLEPDLRIPEAALLNDSAINFEELAKYEPQVILCNKSVYESNSEQLEAVGVTPVMIKFGEFEDVQEVIRIVGEIFDCQDRAKSLIAYQQDILDYFEQKQDELPKERLNALYLNAPVEDGTYRVFTGKHLASEMLKMAGYNNVAEDLQESTIVSVSMEQILAWNPDVIFLSNFNDFTPEEFVNGDFGQEWMNIEAVKNQKIYKTPVGMYRWDTFCVETPLMVKWLGQVENQEVFHEYDIREDIRNFYGTYMDYELSDEEMDRILNTELNIYLK